MLYVPCTRSELLSFLLWGIHAIQTSSVYETIVISFVIALYFIFYILQYRFYILNQYSIQYIFYILAHRVGEIEAKAVNSSLNLFIECKGSESCRCYNCIYNIKNKENTCGTLLLNKYLLLQMFNNFLQGNILFCFILPPNQGKANT